MSSDKKETEDIKIEETNSTIEKEPKHKKRKKTILSIIIRILLAIFVLWVIYIVIYYYDYYKPKKSFYIKTDFFETDNNSKSTFSISEEKIIYICHYTNFAWGYENGGHFIDSKGQLYFFKINDYLTTDALNDMDELIPYLEIIKKNTKPSAIINMKYVEQLYKLTSKIDTTAQYSTVDSGCDMGSTDIFCYNSTTDDYIMCFSDGDETKILEDKYAKKIKDIYDNKIVRSINSAPEPVTRTSVYPLKGIYFKNITCGKTNLKGNYIALTKNELLEFGSQYGCDVSSILSDCETKVHEEYMYFIKFHNSEYELNENDRSSLLWHNNKIDFIIDNNNTSTTVETTSNITKCFIAAVPAVYNVDILTDIKDAQNNSWKKIRPLDINKSNEVYRDTTVILNSKEYDEFKDNEFDKNYLVVKSEEEYHFVLTKLSKYNLKTKEYNSMNKFFEKKAVPNFDEGVLFIKFDLLSNTEKIEKNNMILFDKSLYTGVEMVETNKFSLFSNYKGVITYVYIPNNFLNPDTTYVVR